MILTVYGTNLFSELHVGEKCINIDLVCVCRLLAVTTGLSVHASTCNCRHQRVGSLFCMSRVEVL